MNDNSSYLRALLNAHAELETLKVQEREIFIRKARLQKSINALYPLAFPDSEPDVSSLALPDALRLVFGSAGRFLSASDVKSKLDDIGYDLSKFDNPLTNIHTTMNRMLESGELTKAPTDGGRKTFGPGPDLKEAPDITNVTEEAVDEAVKAFKRDQ